MRYRPFHDELKTANQIPEILPRHHIEHVSKAQTYDTIQDFRIVSFKNR